MIRALYQPNPPETISKIQEVLHRLQRSPEGWQLAQSLIAHREDNIRFYAALTLIIKLNRDRYARMAWVRGGRGVGMTRKKYRANAGLVLV